jgi:hypothetical protein
MAVDIKTLSTEQKQLLADNNLAKIQETAKKN